MGGTCSSAPGDGLLPHGEKSDAAAPRRRVSSTKTAALRAAGNAADAAANVRRSTRDRGHDLELGIDGPARKLGDSKGGRYPLSELAWLAIFLCLLRLPIDFVMSFFSAEWKKVYTSTRIHLRLCFEGMCPWHAMVLHALPVSSLHQRVYFKNALVPTKATPPAHEHERVKVEYLSKVCVRPRQRSPSQWCILCQHWPGTSSRAHGYRHDHPLDASSS
jgi:hypothetical protein